MGATADPVAEFIAALRQADTALVAARDRLVAARVHDTAFGKLFEARAVHDAYHQRLPEMGRNFDEAREVLGHFIKGLEGGHRIVPVPAPGQATRGAS
jgi:hypothetical protein